MSANSLPKLDPDLLEWATKTIQPGAEPFEVRGLRFCDSPWLIRYPSRDVVLRVVSDAAAVDTETIDTEAVDTEAIDTEAIDTKAIDTEATALRALEGRDVPAPRVLGLLHRDADSALLTCRVEGDSTIPRETSVERLRALGCVAARLSRVPVPKGMPRRTAPIGGVDLAELRANDPPALMVAAERAIADYLPTGRDGLLRQGMERL